MTAAGVVVLVHALIAVLFIAGLIGRWIILGRRRSGDRAGRR